MKQMLVIIAIMALITAPVIAMNCGPGCPACSGPGNNSTNLIVPGAVSLNSLIIPDGDEETGILNLRTGIFSWMEGGVGYAFKGEKTIWNLRIKAIEEKDSSWRPAVQIGTGSVQTGKSDQSLYLQTSKTLELNKTSTLNLSAGITSLIPEFNKIYGLAGATISYKESWSSFISFDGKSIHPGISWNPNEWLTVAGLMIEAETPAILAGFQYSR